jgi:hypothetical protein
VGWGPALTMGGWDPIWRVESYMQGGVLHGGRQMAPQPVCSPVKQAGCSKWGASEEGLKRKIIIVFYFIFSERGGLGAG